MIAGGAVGASGSELRGALLRQPHGFEGFTLVHDGLVPDHLVAPEREEHEKVQPRFGSARSALSPLHDIDDDGVPYGPEAFRLESGPFPLAKEVPHEVRERINTQVDP